MLDQLDFNKLNILSREANNRLALINMKEAIENKIDTKNLLNIALEDIIFAFTKIKEEELLLADELKNILQKTREGLGNNFDPQDPVFVTLKDELERLFNKKNLVEVTKKEMEENISALNEIYEKAKELERKNQLLKAKYDYDEKYARLHKRLMEKDPLTDSEIKLCAVLSSLKFKVDEQVEKNTEVLSNENFVGKMILRLVLEQFQHKIDITPAIAKNVKNILVNEYINEYQCNPA